MGRTGYQCFAKMRCFGLAVTFYASMAFAVPSNASDHLDAPSVVADPRADIGDLYAWMSPDGHRLNLVMTVVGKSFSNKIEYIFHIDSGDRFDRTTSTLNLVCKFGSATAVDCALGKIDRAQGDASLPEGLLSDKSLFRIFAGLRDDPFFNNVHGTRAMYTAATRALSDTARYDAAGCPHFNTAQTASIHDAWRSADGGPASNFLKDWTSAAIVTSIDLAPITKGGSFIAVWAATTGPTGQIDRAGRPLTGNALLVTLGSATARDAIKERYNRASPSTGQAFVADIGQGVALYDGLDGRCGNSLLIDHQAPATRRYWPLAALLADDRLWVNSRSAVCNQSFAVELAALGEEPAIASDCGGRSPTYDAVNIFRSLLAGGAITGISDGVHSDEQPHSTIAFPFLAAPESALPAS